MQVLCHTYLISSAAQMSFAHFHTTTKPSVLQMLANYYPSLRVRYVISVRQAGSPQLASLYILTSCNDAVSVR
jgi:hypothetical protein